MDDQNGWGSNPHIFVLNSRSRKQNMTKRAQLAKRWKNMTEEGAAARCVRQIFPSLATWWVFILHNRNLHEWSGIHSTRMYPSDPTQKQVLVVRPRGGRSGKNWRIFVRPREVVVKMNFSPQAAGRRWNGYFHPRPDRKVASCRGFGLETQDFSLCTPNQTSFIIKSTSWEELHFSLAIIPDKVLDHNEPKKCSSECLNHSWWKSMELKSNLTESFVNTKGSPKKEWKSSR